MGRDVTTMKVWVRRRLGIGRTYQVPKPFAHMSVFENVLVAATHGGGLSIAGGARGSEGCAGADRASARSRASRRARCRCSISSGSNSPRRSPPSRSCCCSTRSPAASPTPNATICSTILPAIHARGRDDRLGRAVIHALKRIATRLAVLHFGAIICEGAPDAVLADERVRRCTLERERSARAMTAPLLAVEKLSRLL